jgi:hypothetical protein
LISAIIAKNLNKVLQEVAAARNILVTCGSAEVDGYAFCLGVEVLIRLYNVPPDLQSLVRSVVYLIRGAIFRPRGLGWVSNEVCPLSELIDMYHTHEASLYSDKVYALLGMSSDDFRTAGLAPDYNVPWKDLFQALTRYVLCEEISVEVSSGGDSAIIESEGCILGKISFANVEATWNGRQHVGVTWRSTQGTATMTGSRSSHWDLQPSAKQIAIGDAICLFQGTSKPTVIRFCVDHWAVILIAATPPRIVQAGSEDVEWSRYLQNVKSLRTRSFRCLWN